MRLILNHNARNEALSEMRLMARAQLLVGLPGTTVRIPAQKAPWEHAQTLPEALARIALKPLTTIPSMLPPLLHRILCHLLSIVQILKHFKSSVTKVPRIV